jgi:DNA-binding MarR family transcriptional regulator
LGHVLFGAIALAERPLTLPRIARRMGLIRQSVHASVDRFVRFVELGHSADRRRSPLVSLTKQGRLAT